MLLAALLAAHFSMSQVLSAPFVGDLAASPDGKAVAFVANERGRRNIYFAVLPGKAHRITPYTQDDGQALFSSVIAPGNRVVAYVRGEGMNRRGEYPNPISLPVPPRQTVWLVSTSAGAPVRVGEGHSPAISPLGNRIVWLWRGQPYAAMLNLTGATPRVARRTRLFSIRGQLSDPMFSPDGSRIAFVNDRGDHAFIVVFDLARGSLTYATPNFAHDLAPKWSPDGKSIAFIRTPGTLESEDPYKTYDKEPWSIWIVDVATGAAHQIWQADRGMGSVFYPLDAAHQLFWSRDGQIAFPWEKDGWRHLYAVSSNGGAARLITPGAFEVESAAENLDLSGLVFASNLNDIDRRHISRVDFDGSGFGEDLWTDKPGSQWAPTALAKGEYVYIQSDYRMPPTVFFTNYFKTFSDKLPVDSVGAPAPPGDFPKHDLVEPQLVTFNAPDGLLIHGQLFVPNDGVSKHCGLIFVHGGSRRQMLPGFHYMEAYTNLYELNQYYANHGCEVLSINYRSGIMYGHDFREAKNSGARGASEYQDVLAGARFLQSRPEVDPARIGIYGLSYGGYLTALALGRNSDIFRAGVDMAGVHNWATTRDADYGRQVGTPGERAIAEESSPISAVDTWRSPVFISQGDDDRNVEFSQGVDLATRLRARGVEVVQLVFPNETHENLTFAHMLQLYQTSADWLLQKLGAI